MLSSIEVSEKVFAHLILIFRTHCIHNNKQSQNCGLPYIQPYEKRDLKIIRGTEALPNSFPWIVSIRLRHVFSNGNSYIGNHFCGGTLISKSYVLTAAHCVYEFNNKSLIVIIGSNSINESLNSTNIYKIAKIVVHESYSNHNKKNDIALLKLENNVEFSSIISTVCLPDDDYVNIINRTTTLIGW